MLYYFPQNNKSIDISYFWGNSWMSNVTIPSVAGQLWEVFWKTDMRKNLAAGKLETCMPLFTGTDWCTCCCKLIIILLYPYWRYILLFLDFCCTKVFMFHGVIYFYIHVHFVRSSGVNILCCSPVRSFKPICSRH